MKLDSQSWVTIGIGLFLLTAGIYGYLDLKADLERIEARLDEPPPAPARRDADAGGHALPATVVPRPVVDAPAPTSAEEPIEVTVPRAPSNPEASLEAMSPAVREPATEETAAGTVGVDDF